VNITFVAGKEAIPRPGHQPSSNGCGSQGISVGTFITNTRHMQSTVLLFEICLDRANPGIFQHIHRLLFQNFMHFT
jgi:hypothetical protein